MISFKKFIAGNEDGEALMRVIQLLLQGIGLHAVEGDPEAYSRFRQNIDQVLLRVGETTSSADLPAQAGAALKLLDEHNRRTTIYLKSKGVELQAMVRMLTAAVGSISGAGEENLQRLRDIGQQLEGTAQVEDVRQVKLKLGECLDDIRKEPESPRTETGRTVERLSPGQESPQTPYVPSGATDAGTGLPTRKEAEEVLAKACQDGVSAYAVAVQIAHIPIFNARFGYAVGDQILKYFAGFLRKQWPGRDLLFRWSDTTIVALLYRTSRLERVRDEVGRVMEHKYEHTVEMASRTVLLPISQRWAVFPMMAQSLLLFRNIDSVISHQTSRG